MKEIIDRRETAAQYDKDGARNKEELAKRQPENFFEQFVSSCVQEIISTSSPGCTRNVYAHDVFWAVRKRQRISSTFIDSIRQKKIRIVL